jgi:hypothetical protein
MRETHAAHNCDVKRESTEPAALHRIDAPSRIKGRGAASNPEGRFE